MANETESGRGGGLAVSAGSSLGAVLGASVIGTILWYCFDDMLAGMTGIGSLGTIRWFHVLCMVGFVSTILSVAGMDFRRDG